jgi:hypothetical protein
VADQGNNRVLYFPKGSTTAAAVYGQPDFTSNDSNNGGLSATSLYGPEAVAVDASGDLYVTDSYNNRVLYYSAMAAVPPTTTPTASPTNSDTPTLVPPTVTATPTPLPITATATPSLRSAPHFTNFLPDHDGFSFPDTGATGSATLTTDMFLHEFGLTHLSPLDTFVYYGIYKDVGAGGLSYGFALASALNYLHLPQPVAGPYALNVSGNLADKQPADAANAGSTASTILNAIAFYHGTQTTAQAQQQQSTDRTSLAVGDLLARIEASITAGQPAILDLSGSIQGLGTQGHAVLAYGYTTNTLDPQHPSAPAVLVSVYDPSYPKDNDQAVTFWQDTSGQWHWYYTLYAAYLPYQASPVTWSGPSGGDTNLDVPSLQLASQQGTEPSAGARPGTYLEFENTSSLTITDSQGHTASIAGVGALPQGTIPGLLPVVPEDAANVPGSGVLFLPETSAFTLTQTASDATAATSLSLVGLHGLVQVSRSGAPGGQPLSVSLDQTGQDLTFGSPSGAATPGAAGTLSVTFAQHTAAGALSYTLTGLPADVREVRLAPDGQSVTVQAGATTGAYALAVTTSGASSASQAAARTSLRPGQALPASSAGATHTTIYPSLPLGAFAKQVAQPSTLGGPATLRSTFPAGSPHPPTTQKVNPARLIAFDGGNPVAPGATITIHAAAGTFPPRQHFTLVASGTLPPVTGFQAADDGSANGIYHVPANATSGIFIIFAGGSTPASGILQVVKGTIQVVHFIGTPPPLVINNNRRTVVGGRKAACSLAANTKGKFQPGCETVSSMINALGAPGARVLYTLTYADRTRQIYTATADRHGSSLHPFNVVYLPPPGSTHGQPSTVAYISVFARLKNGTSLGPVTTRFSVIR